uniref:COP1-interacting protein 7 n=2 Tax=Anthurium amnicola TaxID=1678845 RepID=A0A1D1ZHT4_9ARAE
MKSETRLDSALFHLTPTRTRCDLVIKANGKTEKIASGLLNPFLAHLKTAQDQIAKGGYSITLEPDPGADTTWFTKGTLERFVRFVSTPEVLERVNTIESEISQIEEAIAIQGNENLHLSTVEEHQSRPVEYAAGSKSTSDADATKAIVLYKPGVHKPEENGSMAHEENSKVQLLKVLETRKTVLQKEQGMAFARAAAAGFDMDNIAHLISFAECFKAARLLEACLKFMELWRGKHESGQWLEIEAAEAMSIQSEFSAMNASGIMLSADMGKQKEHREQWPTSNGIEIIGKVNGTAVEDMNSDPSGGDKRLPGGSQVPVGSNEFFQGQFPHPPFPQWPVHPPPGAPVFQPFPIQGMPYYQNYPAGGPYFPPAYTPVEDPRFNTRQRMRSKRHSMDSKGSNVESESYDINTRSQEEDDKNSTDLEKEASQRRESRRRSGRSRKKQSGTVVIRNLNYITSKKHDSASGSESSSASGSETEDSSSDTAKRNKRSHKKPSRLSKNKGSLTKSTETVNWQCKEEVAYGQEVDSGNWQVFQSFLLRDDEERGTGADRVMLSGEKEPPVKRRQNKAGVDDILPPERDSEDALDRRMIEFDTVDGKATRMYKHVASNDDKFHIDGGGSRDRKSDVLHEEMGVRGRYMRGTSEDFMVYGRDKVLNSRSSDPLTENEYEHARIMDKGSSYAATDESFIVPVRSGSPEQHGTVTRTAIDVDSEYPSAPQETDSSNKLKIQLSYEPDDLSLMPERGMERESIGYDPALDYGVEVQIDNDAVVENGKQEDAAGTRKGLKKADKEKKLRTAPDGFEKRKMDALLRKGKLSNPSPLAEAQARANKLRAFKADLQKAKKEQEEEEIRRLEALKRERQKRIAARSSNADQSPSTPQQRRTQIPTNLSPISHRGSKFSDSEPGSSLPLRKLHIRASSVGSTDSQKITRSIRPDVPKQAAGNGLSRSVSSLPVPKKEVNSVTPEPKTASVQRRRLSDPEGRNVHSSSLKLGSSDVSPKQNTSEPKGSGKPRASSLRSVGSDCVPKKHLSDDPQNKKISTIMNVEKSKPATLPEPKSRASRDDSDKVRNKSVTDESTQKGNGSKLSVTSEGTKTNKSKESSQQLSNGEDNAIIEKIVVMLEHESLPVPAPVVQEPEHETETGNKLRGANDRAKNEHVPEYAAIRAPPSPIVTCDVSNNPDECQLQQPKSYKVNLDYEKDDSKNIKFSVSDKSYQAPYARATSLEDPCTRSLEYTKVPPTVSSENASTTAETVKVHVPHSTDPSVEEFNETIEKSRGKESLKGFRKLLKFGRKSHGAFPGEPSLESDISSVDDQMVVDTSFNEVHTLKNLISQDDTHAEGTPPKASRHFSILSPFRSKATEKKLVA